MVKFRRIRLFGLDFEYAAGKYHCVNKPSYIKSIFAKIESGHASQILVKRLRVTTISDVVFHISIPSQSLRFRQQGNIATPYGISKTASAMLHIGTVKTQNWPTGLELNIGPLKALSRKCFLSVIKDQNGLNDLWVDFHETHELLKDASLPIDVTLNANANIRPVFLNDDLYLDGINTPFSAYTKLGVETSRIKQWNQESTRINATDLKDVINLSFEDTDQETPFHLHPFSRIHKEKQHTLSAVGIDAESLAVSAETGESDARFKVTGISVQPNLNGYVHTYALSANNVHRYHRWRIHDPVKLAIRATTDLSSPSGFLLHKTDEAGTAVQEVNGEYPILGLRRELKIDSSRVDALIVLDASDTVAHPHLGEDISRSSTAPLFTFLLDNVSLNRPGIALTARKPFDPDDPLDDVIPWRFESDEDKQYLVPICPDEAIADNGVQQTAFCRINAGYAQLDSRNTDVTHESSLRIEGLDRQGNESKPKLRRLFEPVEEQQPYTSDEMPTTGAMAAPSLGAHSNTYNFGNYVITKEWQEGEVPEYVPLILQANGELANDTTAMLREGFALDPSYEGTDQDVRVRAEDLKKENSGLAISGSSNRLIGIVKLGKEEALASILSKESVSDPKVSDELPSKLTEKAWTGLVLFEQLLDLSRFPLLASLLPKSSLRLRYLGLSPDADNRDTFSTYGKAKWVNESEDNELSTPRSRKEEFMAYMKRVELVWSSRSLVRFFSETVIKVRSFAGAGNKNLNQNQYVDYRIYGTIDEETGRISFLATSDKPEALLEEPVGPIKQASIKSIEITRDDTHTEFQVDGNVELEELKIGEWPFKSGDGIKFKGLKFGFAENLDIKGKWLTLDYPSIQFDFAKGWKLFDFSGCKLELKSLGFDTDNNSFKGSNLIRFDWNDWLDDIPSIRLGMNLNLGKMPMLSSSGCDSLTFGFDLGLPYKDGDFFNIDIGKPRFGVRALGFNKLDIKFMRFLELSARKVKLESKEYDSHDDKALWLTLIDLKLKILSTTLIDDLSFAHYWMGDKSGFVGLLGKDKGGLDLSFIKINWVLIGRDIRLNNEENQLLYDIVSISPAQTNLHSAILSASEKGLLIPEDNPEVGEWVFAAGIELFNGFLIGKFLFHDGAYYGLSIDGPMLREWFGYDLAMSVVYIVKNRPEEDMFRLSVRVPSIDLGGFSFNGGTIVIEVQMNGGFLLDLGYPWLDQNGERLWDRGFGMMLSGLMGKGGSFLAKRSTLRTRKLEGAKPGKLILIEGGIAAMVGIGGSFSAGPFRVSAYAGIYYAVEGSLLFFAPDGASVLRLDLVGLRLSGAIGIQARGVGELNWWIISLRVEVVAGAEARLTVFWGALENHSPSTPDLPTDISVTDRLYVQVDFVLYARASAKACIGSGWFKVCKSISAGVSMPYRQKLYLS